MDKNIKYVHLLYRNETKFNSRIVRMINDNEQQFNASEHLFVSCYKEQYEQLPHYKNIVLNTERCNLINKYCSLSDVWIIMHSCTSIKDFLFIHRKYLNKVIFRYWGGGIDGYCYKFGEPIRNVIKKYLNYLYQKKLANIKIIGIANIVDVLDIERTFKRVCLMPLPYIDENAYTILQDCKNSDEIKNTDCINIMIGHRGSAEGAHIKIIKLLQKFKNHNCKLFLPLSYGDSVYIQKVKEYIEKNKYENVVVIDKFMDYSQYAKLLSKMDIGIFNGKNSYALGNIAMLLFLGKKIYLNDDGIIKKAFIHEQVPYGKICDIEKESFQDFIKPVTYKQGVRDNLIIHNSEFHKKQWIDLLEKLDGKTNE